MAIRRCLVAACAVLAAGSARADPASVVALPSEPGRWKARTELLFDDATKSLVRCEIRVWDQHPSQHLVFTWAPDPPRTAAIGPAAGRGHLTWRPEAAPSYDLSAIAIDYRGDVVDGRPEGTGTERDADGRSYEGQWKAGLPDGRGHLRLATGADYEGPFRNGKAEGRGLFVDVDGETFDGPFRNGLREGLAKTTLPNHVAYRSTWHDGGEVAASRKIRLAQVGSAGGAADQDIRIGVTVDGHPADDGNLGYASIGSGETLKIVPDDKVLMSVWKGNGDIAQNALSDTGTFGMDPATLIPVRLTMNVQNRGTQPAQVVGAVVKVDSSAVDRQPAVEIQSLGGKECSADQGLLYAPAFLLKNYGWGGTRNPSVQFTFVNNGESVPANYQRTKPVAGFERRQTVDFEQDLGASGVKVASLRASAQRKTPLQCRTTDPTACLGELRAGGLFGSLGSYVSIEAGNLVEIGVKGVLAYDWTDDAGATQHRTSPFKTTLLLGELPQAAECGEGGEPVPVARNPLELKLHATDYRLPMKFQSTIQAGRTARYSFSLHTTQSSDHRLSIVLQLADGREIPSRPIDLTYFVPNR